MARRSNVTGKVDEWGSDSPRHGRKRKTTCRVNSLTIHFNYEVTQVKITNSDIIKSGERELIDTITGDLDWHTIEQIVRERHKLTIQDDIEYKQGDLIVHDNKVAYRLDFDIKVTLSVIFDRDGNCLSLTTQGDSCRVPEATANGNLQFEEEAESPSDLFFEKMDADHLQADDSKSPMPEMYDTPPDIKPEKNPQENISQMASHIAEMISQINEDTPPGKES